MLLLFVLFLCCPSSSLHGVAADPGPDPRATPTSDAIPTPAPTRRPVVTPGIRPFPPRGRDPKLFERADADLLYLRLAVGRAQVSHLAAGRYWQAPATHDRLPVVRALKSPEDGSTVYSISADPPDPLSVIAGELSWYDLGIELPDDLAISAWVDTYDGPRGQGWVIRGEFALEDGTVCSRVMNAGPESGRDRGWVCR